MEAVYQFSGALWEYSGEAPWVFITLGGEDADEIRTRVPPSGGFGSVKVNAQIGETEWSTSIFADKASGPLRCGERDPSYRSRLARIHQWSQINTPSRPGPTR